MAQKTVTVAAERRTGIGKGAARQLRARGRIPAVIYGHGRAPESLSVAESELERALTGIAAESTVIDLAIDGDPVKTLIREIQRHPYRSTILHVDFYELRAGEKITVEIRLHLAGTPVGVKDHGGVLDQVLREVEIEVLPSDIPARIELDVSALGIGDSLHVSDLTIPNAEILSDSEATICTVVPPRVEEEAPAVAEVEEEEASTEPELIRRPKTEEGAEGEEEEE